MRKIAVFLALPFLFSCNNSTNDASAENVNLDPQALIEQYFKHFNAHEWNAMAAMYSEPAEMKDPSYGPTLVSMNRDYIEAKYRELNLMIPDVKDSLVSTLVCGNQVVVEFISKGTINDVGPFELPICTIFEIKDGKITKDFTYYDLE